MKLLKKDFDKAVKLPWSVYTCVFSQMAIRLGAKKSTVGMSPASKLLFGASGSESPSPETLKIRDIFDENFYQPGDEKKPILQKLRDSLPIILAKNNP